MKVGEGEEIGGDSVIISLLQAREVEWPRHEVSRDRVGSRGALYGMERTTIVLRRMILIPISRESTASTGLGVIKGLDDLLVGRRNVGRGGLEIS